MKRILSSLIVILCITACSKPHYTIKGVVEGDNTGNILLLTLNEGVVDTLSKAPIQNKAFKITGETSSPVFAYLMIEGTRDPLQIILENIPYEAVIHTTDNLASKVEAEGEQTILNEFLAISNEYKRHERELYKDYSEAVKDKDNDKVSQIQGEAQRIAGEALEKEKQTIAKNTNSYATALVVYQKINSIGIDELTALYHSLGDYAKASTFGKLTEEHINKIRAVAIGQIAPNFTLNTPEGKPLSLHDIKGKVKLIDFWASWCGPCRRANPDVVKLYQKYNKQGFEILGVSLDRDRDKWIEAIQNDNLTWAQVSDLKYWSSDVAKLYTVTAIPHTVLLDANNKIIAKNLRGQALEDKVIEILK
jgi:thiol-disulfide isomerase/thioredoxin